MSEPKVPESPRRRRERSSVTHDEILRAAESVAKHGYNSLTMRAVATQMGASPMALYRYFGTKEELVDAMLDRVLGRLEFAAPTNDWLADLRTFALAHRAMLAQDAWAIIPLFTHSNPGPNASVIGETALRILQRGGIGGEQSVATFSAILALNYGWFAFTAAREALPSDDHPRARLAASLASLPGDRFPLTRSVAQELGGYGSDPQYRLALDQLIAGVGATHTTTDGAS